MSEESHVCYGAINHLIPSFNLGQITVGVTRAPQTHACACASRRDGGRNREKQGMKREGGSERTGL